MADWYVEQVFTYVLLYQYAKKVVSDSPGLEDFGYLASEFCSLFTLLANEFLLGNSHCRRTVINPAH